MAFNQKQFARNRHLQVVALIVFALLGAPLLPAKAASPAAQSPACESHQLASLDLELPDNGQVLVPITVNNARFYMYFEIASPFTAVSEQAVACLYRYPLRLGSDVLRRMHVYLATKENMMYFTGNADETPMQGAGSPHATPGAQAPERIRDSR